MKKILLSVMLASLGLAIKSSAAPIAAQNFEGALAPWTVTTTGGGTGWTVVSGATATQLGTIPAHTKYAVVDEGAQGTTAFNNPTYMTSPVFSLAGTTAPYLAFDWIYYGAWLSASPYTHEAAWVEMSTNGGTSYSLVDSIYYTASGGWETRFISLASYIGSSNCMLRIVYTDHGKHIIGIGLDNILVYDASTTDIGLNSISPVAGSATSYYISGNSITFTGNVTNFNSTTSISSFTASYKVGTASVVTNTISTPVAPLSSTNFSFTTPYTCAGLINTLPVTIWVTTSGETNFANDTLGTSINVVPFKPKKRMLFEEATGTWCGWCVRGIVYMDSLWRAQGDNVNIISVHNSDPMASMNSSTDNYDNLISGNYISGYPSMVIDRRYTTDPSACFTDYNNDNTMFGFANLGITTTTAGTVVTAHAKVEPAMNMLGDYRLELLVTEDDVTSGGGSSGTWLQHNYYSGGSAGPMHTIGYDFVALPTDIPGVKFPFVARYTIPNNLNGTPNGVAGSLPSQMHFGKEYTYDFDTIQLPAVWNAAKLRYTLLLIDNNPANVTYGTVLNATHTGASPAYSFTTVSFVGVQDVKLAMENLELFPNPATDQAHVRFTLSQNAKIGFSIVDMTGRTVMNEQAEEMQAGNNQLNISTSQLPAGVYNFVINADGNIQTKRLVIVK